MADDNDDGRPPTLDYRSPSTRGVRLTGNARNWLAGASSLMLTLAANPWPAAYAGVEWAFTLYRFHPAALLSAIVIGHAVALCVVWFGRVPMPNEWEGGPTVLPIALALLALPVSLATSGCATCGFAFWADFRRD